MVSLNGITGVNVQRVYSDPQNFVVRRNEYENLFDSNTQNAELKPQKSIGLGEGIGLLFKGVGKQVKDIVSSVVEHPVRTLGVVGATTAGLMALPLVGIPTAVGGAALALGFAGLATVNGVKHTSEFIKNNSNGEYDKARENLEQIGGDSVDLALSAPFVPKAIKEVKNFAKYGKVALNTSALSEIKSAKGLKGKLSALKSADKEASRAMNYNKVAETEIAKLTEATEVEKANIRKYIKDYNVPKDKIAEVVLDQWAKESGISTKPTLTRESLGKTTLGYASPYECKIAINDGGKNVVKRNTNCNTQRYQHVSTRLNKNNYEYTYKDTQTGEIFTDTADKATVDLRNKLINSYKNLTKEANEILTVTHEREHIDQFTKMIASGEKLQVSPSAQKTYSQMIGEMKPLTIKEFDTYRQMAHYQPKRRTLAAYTMDPMEIGARAKEIELLKTKKFHILNNVFSETNKAVIPETGKSVFILNGLRSQSASA